MTTVDLSQCTILWDSATYDPATGLTPTSSDPMYTSIAGLNLDWSQGYTIEFDLVPISPPSFGINVLSLRPDDDGDASFMHYLPAHGFGPVTAATTATLVIGPANQPNWGDAQADGESHVAIEAYDVRITAIRWTIGNPVPPPDSDEDAVPAYISALNYFDMVRNYLLFKPLKVMLVTSDFTFDPDAHQNRSSIFNEASGAGYAAGGIDLVDADVLLDNAGHAVELVASDVDFGTVTLTDVASMIVYLSTGSAATDRIVTAFTFNPTSRTNASFSFLWSEQSAVDPSLGVVARFTY